MQTIEKRIDYFSCRGKIILGGYFNARVGELNEFLMKEDDTYLSMPHDDTFEYILPRVSHDSKTTNQYGKWLIDLCMDNQLYILNGRTLGDLGASLLVVHREVVVLLITLLLVILCQMKF